MKILKIADLVEDPTAPRWLDYPDIPGVRVRLRLPDIPESTKMMGYATQSDGVDEAGKPKYRIDWPDYHNRLLHYAVTGWEGLKVEHLALIFPVHKLKIEGAEPGAELAFCPENRDFLLGQSSGFFQWLMNEVQQWDKQLRGQEEQDKENLSDTPSTSPTLTP